MFVLICATLLFSVRGIHAETGASPDVSQGNCSIFINDLTESDSGAYQLRVNGLLNGNSDGLTYYERAVLSVKRHSSTLTFDPSAEHHSSNVTCEVSFTNNIIAEETVTLNVTFYPNILNSSKCEVQSGVLTCVCVSKGIPLPYIIWPLLNNHSEYSVITTVSRQTIHSTLTVKDHSNTVVECVGRSKVGEVQHTIPVITSQKREANQHGPSAQLPWVVVAAVSLFVNVISIILIMFLWHTRKKVKPNQEDRTYMSIKKTDVSSDYEVIAQPLN
ncbi:Sialic acid-binding Ig-like lectin 6 [Dissostichus eleginoides]|uniref:Sialic acid-binding Ig-like lectin 6 n=1 Tax=Dissostichus eleginoides TaxID=100907 RepID=A0AAD9C5G6_DISEL|nr:Sialic acid-binding Ig-like lectin 6 [Dissostichus eleginoides]